MAQHSREVAGCADGRCPLHLTLHRASKCALPAQPLTDACYFLQHEPVMTEAQQPLLPGNGNAHGAANAHEWSGAAAVEARLEASKLP
jgi:hypothetical protein